MSWERIPWQSQGDAKAQGSFTAEEYPQHCPVRDIQAACSGVGLPGATSKSTGGSFDKRLPLLLVLPRAGAGVGARGQPQEGRGCAGIILLCCPRFHPQARAGAATFPVGMKSLSLPFPSYPCSPFPSSETLWRGGSGSVLGGSGDTRQHPQCSIGSPSGTLPVHTNCPK